MSEAGNRLHAQTEADREMKMFLAKVESEQHSLKMHLGIVGICTDRILMQNQGLAATTSAHQ